MQLSKYIFGELLRNMRSRFSVSVVNPSLGVQTTAAYSNHVTQTETSANKEHDDLYKRVVIEVRAHDRSVLDSYEKFVKLASEELLTDGARVLTEDRDKARFIERWTLLKSRFGNRKHMRQYEMRTYTREFELTYLTGSTCDTLLEYIQRNLPEGCAMHVHKTRMLALPEQLDVTQSSLTK